MTKFYSTRHFPHKLRKGVRDYAYKLSVERDVNVSFSVALFHILELGLKEVSTRQRGARRTHA